MKRGGIIIRLIDVAMIILFGFIIISRLKLSEIELPSEAKPSSTETISHIVTVKISRDYTNQVDRFILIDDGNELGDFSALDELESMIINKNKYRGSFVRLLP